MLVTYTYNYLKLGVSQFVALVVRNTQEENNRINLMQCVQVLNANGEIQNFKFPKLTYPYYENVMQQLINCKQINYQTDLLIKK